MAQYAHVGVATVSRVLSGKGYVKEETREHILQAISALNYTPNERARNLYYQKSGVIAVVVPMIAHPFFAELLQEVETALREYDYNILVCNSYSDESNERRFLEMLKRQLVDGILFGAHSRLISQYEDFRRPIVALDRSISKDVPRIYADHRTGGRLAAEELLRAGCRSVLQFCGSDTVDTLANQRHLVFEEVMGQHGVPCTNCLVDDDTFRIDYYAELTEHIFEDNPEIDGVFATDEIALCAIRRAVELGRRVPEDLKIVAYDGSRAVRLASPSVTTVVQPIQELARESVRLMMRWIEGEVPERTDIVLPVSLRPGISTRGASL